MPEAVASNSTPVSSRQRQAYPGAPVFRGEAPFEALSPSVQRDFDAVEEMLRAYAMMTNCMMESGDDFSLYSKGVHLIHQLIMLRLDETAEQARELIETQARPRSVTQPVDHDLFNSIQGIVAATLSERGIVASASSREWTADESRIVLDTTASYYRELVKELGSEASLIEAASLLPWIELRIRKALFGVEEGQPDDEALVSLRDRLIAEQSKEGVSPAELSQAFNIRRSTVERIIGRLQAEEGEERAAL